MTTPIQPGSIFIIVPAYNEAAALGRTLQPLLDAGYTVVAVDDGSTDRTWEAMGQLPIVRLRHAANLGQGAALATGLVYAERHAATAAVTFDADGQHDPTQIPRLLDPIFAGEADVVLGSRFLDPRDARLVPPARRFVLKGGIAVNGLFTGVWLSDAHNGFRALSRRALEQIRLRENGFAHATEILEELRRTGLRYQEVPTRVTYSRYSLAKGQPSFNCLGILFDLAMRRVLP